MQVLFKPPASAQDVFASTRYATLPTAAGMNAGDILSETAHRFGHRSEGILRRCRWAMAAALPVLAGCGGDDAPAVGPAVRDSAGVRVVEYAEVPEVVPAFSLAPEPVYRHGATAGEYSFGLAGRGRLFADGSAALTDDANSEVVLLTSGGAEHSVLAVAGQGPGEVGYVTGLHTLGRDGLVVLDRRNSQLSLFVNGSLARTESLADLQRNTTLWPQGIDAAGGLLAATNAFRSGFEEEWLQGHMARFDLQTGAVDTVASYDFVPGAGNPSRGFGSVAVVDGHFIYTRSDKPEVTWYGADGAVNQIVRWRAEPEYMVEEHLGPLEARLREANRFANPQAPAEVVERMTRDDMARYRADIGKPLPLFRVAFGDAEGRVWLPTHVPAGPRDGSPSYTVISPEGDWLGKVDAPPGLRILDVAGDRVLGVIKNEMNVESVVVFELIGS